ncbi:MAG: two-component system sensor histidine kinase NtrB [Sporomusa sp.]
MECICHKCRETTAVRLCHQDIIGWIAVGLAHEIRNPLTVIKGYLQLQDKSAAYRTDESRSIIAQEVNRIEELINRVVLLAKNKMSDKSPSNLNDIVANIYPAIQQAAARAGIVTELMLDDSLPILQLNTEEIEEIVMQLAYNGIEAMQNNGKLSIKTACQDGQVILSIQDQGCGICPDVGDQIFAPFYTTKAGNVGLGLAISLSIVDRHRGNFEFVSTVGEGSLFKVLFPLPEAM